MSLKQKQAAEVKMKYLLLQLHPKCFQRFTFLQFKEWEGTFISLDYTALLLFVLNFSFPVLLSQEVSIT